MESQIETAISRLPANIYAASEKPCLLEVFDRAEEYKGGEEDNNEFICHRPEEIDELILNDLSPEKILGPVDQRKEVLKPYEWPYSVQGQFACDNYKVDGKEFVLMGSGTIIGPNIVLTAAHNVYCRELAQKELDKNNMTFYPCGIKNYKRYGECKIKAVYYPDEYKIEDEEEWKRNGRSEDYAILVLDKKIGLKTGYFDIYPHGRERLEGKTAYIYGFPGDDDKKHRLYGMPGKFRFVEPGFILHEIDTTRSQSGSAIYIQEGNNYFVIGVHAFGCERSGTYNVAIYLNEARINRIKDWILSYKYLKHIGYTEQDRSDKTYKHLETLNPYVVKLNWKYLKPEHANELARKDLKSLIVLNLSENSIGDEGLAALSKANFENLEELNLRQNIISDIGAQALFKANLSKLTTLDLAKNEIGANGLAHISTNSFPKLTTLDLSLNQIGEAGAATLSEAKFVNLTTLYLEDNQITDQGAAKLSQGNFINLTFLNLGRNQIGDEGATALSGAKFIINLTSLDLEYNQIGYEGATALSKADFEKLTALNLGKNQIGDEGATALSQGNFINLTSLYLGQNQIGDAGATALSGAKFIFNLTSLYLENNQIRDAGATAISKVDFQKLSTLNLWNNQIADQGAAELSQGNFINLTFLNLGRNQIGDAGATALSGAKFIINLTFLHLEYNQIGYEGATALSKADFQKIKCMYLIGNPSEIKRSIRKQSNI